MDPNQDNQGSDAAGANRQAVFTPQTEPVPPADSVDAPTQPTVNLSHPYLSNHPTQTFNTDTGDIILNTGPQKPKLNKRPFIIGGVILAIFLIICVVVLVIIANKSKFATGSVNITIGKVNTEIIFDTSALIPIEIDNNYGYINPENGSQVIEAKFLDASRFYGEYAVVKTGSENQVSATLVINRAGETIFKFEGDSTSTYYDVDNNYWLINGDLYTAKMQKVSPEGTIATYIGNDYMLVMAGDGAITDVSYNESEDDSDSTRGEDISTMYIAKIGGDRIYTCKSYCSVLTVKSGDITYAVAQEWGNGSSIINLSDGNTIYDTQNKISLRGDSIAERSDDGNVKYLDIKNNKVTFLSHQETSSSTISNSGKYQIKSCASSKYSIETINGDVIADCNIDDYYELSPNLYKAYENNFAKTPILIVRDNGLQLLNMDNGETIRAFDGQEASLFDNSPFVYIQNLNSGESYVCNLLSKAKNDSCIKIDNANSEIEGYSNYFVVNEKTGKFYNYNLVEIRG